MSRLKPLGRSSKVVTSYSFSCSFMGLSSASVMRPSSVKIISPYESLSSRPKGNRLLGALRRVRDYAARFVVGKVAIHFLLAGYFHGVGVCNIRAQYSRCTVDEYAAGLNKLVGLATRGVLMQRQVFVDTHDTRYTIY
jgi:hypothetical protein